MSPVNARQRTQPLVAALPARLPDRGTKGEALRAVLDVLVDEFPAGTLLPSDRELADRFGVARMTVRRELERLTADGRIYRVPGAGTFVAERPVALDDVVSSFSEDMRRRGATPGSRVLAQAIVRATPALAQRLELAQRAEVVRIERVRLADGEPLALEEAFLPASRFAGLEREDLAAQSLFALLRDRWGVRLADAVQRVRVVSFDARVARLLDAPAGSPGFSLRTVTRDETRAVVQASTSIYRGDRYEIVLRQRSQPV